MYTRFQLNDDQLSAMQKIQNFMHSSEQDVFILSGSAGTGKTTIIAEVYKLIERMGLCCCCVAPTGKAAKVLNQKLNRMLPAGLGSVTVSTIHNMLYYLATLSQHERGEHALPMEMNFRLRQNSPAIDLLIVDEASMLGDAGLMQTTFRFGSGRLLHDMIVYLRQVYEQGMVDRPVKILFVGDLAQLPPVGSSISPALTPGYLHECYGLRASGHDLTQVMRQTEGSGILSWANRIREQIFASDGNSPAVPINGQDICSIDFYRAIDWIARAERMGQSSVAVVYSNQLALEYNMGVRQMLWGHGATEIKVGDKLLVTRNSMSTGLSNGDLIRVSSLHDPGEVHWVNMPSGIQVALRFRTVSVVPEGALAGREEAITTLILENFLFELMQGEDDKLVQHALSEWVAQRHANVQCHTRDFIEVLGNDPYYNALQLKFGYALTCHKAQGGEWSDVILDPSGVSLSSDSGKRWLYTAVTRAAERLFVVED